MNDKFCVKTTQSPNTSCTLTGEGLLSIPRHLKHHKRNGLLSANLYFNTARQKNEKEN